MLWSIILRLVEIAVEWGRALAPHRLSVCNLGCGRPRQAEARTARRKAVAIILHLHCVPCHLNQVRVRRKVNHLGRVHRSEMGNRIASVSAWIRGVTRIHAHTLLCHPANVSNISTSTSASSQQTAQTHHSTSYHRIAQHRLASRVRREGKGRKGNGRKGNGSAIMRGVRKRSEWGRHKTCSIVLVLACGLGPYREDCAIRRLLLGKLRQAIEHALPDRAIGSRYVLV